MKKFITILLLTFTLFVTAQTTNDIIYNKLMVDMVNQYRKVNKKKTINWSDDLYEVNKIQIHRSDSVFRRGKVLVLKHDMRLLNKLNINEVLAYAGADNNKQFNKNSNPFIIHKLDKSDSKLFLPFIKKYFKELYNDITVETKIIETLGDNKYVVSNLKEGVYSYEGSGVFIDSIVGNKTYIRTYTKLKTSSVKFHVTNNLPEETKNKVRIAYTVMQWHFSPGHRKIILSEAKEMSSSNIMNGSYLISVINIR